MSLIRPTIVLFMLLTAVTGAIYPAIVTVVAQVCFPDAAAGSVIERSGKAVGSELIGQPFASTGYFWSRPSATGPFPYNGAASSGSNLGPTNPALADAVRQRVEALRNDVAMDGPPPVDLATASGSGLDPHISPAAAEYQVRRVAAARGASVDAIRTLVLEHTASRSFGLLGEPRVNVLRLNLALDARYGVAAESDRR
jgi:K+-transporting ATPase ATPase C chain